MKKVLAVMICLVIVCSFVSCNSIKFEETDNKAVVANDGTEYHFVGFEGKVWCLGEWFFWGHVKGEPKQFVHLASTVKTGMYSVNGGQDVLVRYFPGNEFAAIYVKSDLLKTEVALENCIRFEFIEGSLISNDEISLSKKGITDCEQFLTEIKNGQKASNVGLDDLFNNGAFERCYIYGHALGVIQEDINLFIPLEIKSFDDKIYSIEIDGEEYVLPEKWLNILIAEQAII